MNEADFKIKEVDPFDDEQSHDSRHHLDAMAAKGNWDAFQQVKLAVEKVLQAAIRGLMPALFDLLIEENPAFRVVLGLFIFVYIPPYFNGNGRMGRFIIIAF